MRSTKQICIYVLNQAQYGKVRLICTNLNFPPKIFKDVAHGLPCGVALLTSTPVKSEMTTNVEGAFGFSRQFFRMSSFCFSTICRMKRMSLSLFPASSAPFILQRLQGTVTTAMKHDIHFQIR